MCNPPYWCQNVFLMKSINPSQQSTFNMHCFWSPVDWAWLQLSMYTLRRNTTNFCQEAWSLGVSLAKELTFEPMVGFWSVIGQNGVVFEALLIGHVPSCLCTLFDVLRRNMTNFCQEAWSLGVSLAKELTFEPMVGFWSVIGQNGVVFEALLIGHVPSSLCILYDVLRHNMTNFCQEAWSLGVS